MSVRVFERLKEIIRSELFDEPHQSPSLSRAKTLESVTNELKLDLGRLIAERYHVEKILRSEQPDLSDLDAKASKALELGREDLAKAALSKKVDLRAQRQSLIEDRDDLDAQIDGLERALRSLSAPDQSEAGLRRQLEELDTLLSQMGPPRRKDE